MSGTRTKYKAYFKEMLKAYADEFREFEKIHSDYQNRVISQDEYNEKGGKILEIVKEWESRLCSHMESGVYGGYSAGLADKFMNEVRKKFPLFDFIGVKVKKV